MESEVLAKVEKALPFTEGRYPPLARLLPEEKTAFVLRHMLTHQFKSLLKYGAANQDKRDELAFELMLNALRLAQVTMVSDPFLTTELSRWGRSTVSMIFSRRNIDEEKVELLREGTAICLTHFEPIDHGRPLKTVQVAVQANVRHFVQVSRELAEVRKLKLPQFSTWIGDFMVKHPA